MSSKSINKSMKCLSKQCFTENESQIKNVSEECGLKKKFHELEWELEDGTICADFYNSHNYYVPSFVYSSNLMPYYHFNYFDHNYQYNICDKHYEKHRSKQYMKSKEEFTTDRMHSRETQKVILNELGLQSNQSDHSKISVIMYKKLHKEHLLLQRSYAAVCQSLNDILCKSQPLKGYHPNPQQKMTIKLECDRLKRHIDLNTSKPHEKTQCNHLFELRVHESEPIKKIEDRLQIESNDEMKSNKCKNCTMSSVSTTMYKKLYKEHLILERAFATVCQSFNEALDTSQGPEELKTGSQQKKLSKKEFDELKRQIELLTLELQEARDQNELFEFRIHELEQIKCSAKSQTLDKSYLMIEKSLKDLDCQHRYNEIACLKCFQLESQLLDTNNENQKLKERFNSSKRALNELISKYALKEELENLLHRNYKQNNEPEIGYIGSAMTSEDEGLGDDTRRDHSSGPSSLADLQEPEYDVLSLQSLQLPLEFSSKDGLNASLYQNDNCIDRDILEKIEPTREQCKQIESAQNKNEELLRLQLVESQACIERLEQSMDQIKDEKANLEEQVLELEEAENDARLISQRLQQQLETFLDQYESMQSDLINSKKTIEQNSNKIKSFERIEFELRSQIGDMRSAILKQQSLAEVNKNQNRIQQCDDLINRSTVLENETQNVEQQQLQQLQQVDNLYSFLWEKLYRLETQIDRYKETYIESNQNFCSHDFDDDLQLFISAEKLSKGVSGIGSSFEVSQFGMNCDELYKHCDASVRLDDLVLALPLCEAVRPERIDVMIGNNQKMRPSSPSCMPSEIISKISKLETNEQLLRDRLLQLESINKEFVRELELREKIYFEREKKHKEWLTSENEFKYTIKGLKSEKNDLEIKVKDLEIERNNLMEQIVSLRNDLEKTKRRHETEVQDIQKDQNIIVIDLQKHINELESKEQEYIKQLESLESNKIVEQNKLKQINQNYTELKIDLQKERQNIIKLKDNFATELNHLINKHNIYQNELKYKIKELENQEINFSLQLKTFSEREESLKQELVKRENELKKFRTIHEERIKILDEEHQLVENELRIKMEEMESKTSTTVNELEMERNKIHKQLEDAFNGMKCKELEYMKKMNELKDNMDRLEAKLSEFVINKSNCDKIENERMQLKLQIKSIQSSEEELRRKLSETMQKEAAYEETLTKADKIIATLELNYKQRIEELETSETNLKAKVAQLEDMEMRSRSALRPERRSSDSYRKASDLVKELIDAEARECLLKEQMRSLEISVNQLEQQLREADQRKKQMESELKDQDELVSTVVNLQQQIESLKTDLNKSLQSQDSLQDMLKETEKYCSQRDEEMHFKYKSLEDEKCDLEITIQKLKHRLRHTDIQNDSYNSLLITDTFKSIDLSLNNKDEKAIQNISQCSEPLSLDLNSTNNEELEDARLHMEKCFKRAMAVVRMELKQKENIDSLSLTDTEEAFSSLSLSSSPCSSEDSEKNIKDFEILMDETNDCCSSSSSSSPSSMSSRNTKPLSPKNLKIIRKVSCDSLLIGWQMHNREDIMGFQISVNDETVQKVRNPKATKALIHKLDLSQPLIITISTMSYCGQLSNEVSIRYTPTDSSANL